MIIVLHGVDAYRRRERRMVLTTAFQQKFDPSGRACQLIDAGETAFPALVDALRGGGLFSQRRFVTIKSVWNLSADQQTQLLQLLPQIPADVIVCFDIAPPPKKQNALWKALLDKASSDTIEEYGALSQAQLRQFMQAAAQRSGVSLTPAVVQAIVTSATDQDTWRLSLQLHALCHTTQPITPDTVALFFDSAVVDNIFALTDALGRRDMSGVVAALERQYAAGSSDQQIQAVLSRHVATLYKLAVEPGGEFGLHPYAAQKARTQAQQFQPDQLRDLHGHLLELDQASKSGLVNPPAALLHCLIKSIG